MEFEVEKTFNCSICRDTGMMLVPVLYRGNTVYDAKPCDCRRQKIFRERFNQVVAITPEEYGFLTNGLESIKPDLNRHPKQERILQKIKEHPDDSFLFYGLSGCGKTLISWALAQSAALRGKQIFCGTADLLVLSFNTWQFHQRKIENIELSSLEQLQNHREGKWLIFIDEFEKINLSNHTLKTLFGIIKAAKEHGHQLILTANKTLEEIENRWITLDSDGRFDAENYASVVRRRLKEYCIPVDMRLFECTAGHISAVGQDQQCLVCGADFAQWLR